MIVRIKFNKNNTTEDMSPENEKSQETTGESTPGPVLSEPTPTPVQPQVQPQAQAVAAKPPSQSVPITEWIITFFLLAIPLLNIILLFIWSFSSDTNPSKANFAKAYLIILLIFFALTALFAMLFGAALWALIQGQGEGLLKEVLP